MGISVEGFWNIPEVQLLGAYHEALRAFVERKFARDTQRARLQWLKAKAFATATGGVTERQNAVEASEELARKGQEVREMTRDLELLRADVDLIAMVVRLRGALLSSGEIRMEEAAESENKDEMI